MEEQHRDIIDLRLLPEQARIALLDFYNNLSAKYGSGKQKKSAENRKGRFKKFIASPIQLKELAKYSREELHERR